MGARLTDGRVVWTYGRGMSVSVSNGVSISISISITCISVGISIISISPHGQGARRAFRARSVSIISIFEFSI